MFQHGQFIFNMSHVSKRQRNFFVTTYHSNEDCKFCTEIMGIAPTIIFTKLNNVYII